MVLKKSIKRKRRNRRNRRRRRSSQKGAGYSFNFDNYVGGHPEVTTYNNCRTPQADLSPQADSQLAPPGQAPAEVVGVSNDNLAPVQQQAQAPQQAQAQQQEQEPQQVQQAQAPQQAQQTGGRRKRRRRRAEDEGGSPPIPWSRTKYGPSS